jgi:hypothetical protein
MLRLGEVAAGADRVALWWATMRTSSSQARARPLPSLGLLVVAVSVVNADDADPATRENRTVLAGSAFVALVDIFMVSIVPLTGAQSSSGYQASQWQPSACWPPDG